MSVFWPCSSFFYSFFGSFFAAGFFLVSNSSGSSMQGSNFLTLSQLYLCLAKSSTNDLSSIQLLRIITVSSLIYFSGFISFYICKVFSPSFSCRHFCTALTFLYKQLQTFSLFKTQQLEPSILISAIIVRSKRFNLEGRCDQGRLFLARRLMIRKYGSQGVKVARWGWDICQFWKTTV